MQSFYRATLSLAFIANLAHGRSIFVANPAINTYNSLFEASLPLDRYGVTAHATYAPVATGASALAVSGVMPITFSDSVRLSGWSLGAAAGHQEFTNFEDSLVSPGMFYWELMFGRASIDTRISTESGLRGYLEIALRDEMVRRSTELTAFLASQARGVPDHNRALVLRIGTSTEAKARGLIEQPPSRFSFDFDLGLHLPLVSSHAALLLANTKFGIWCLKDWLVCGTSLNYFNSKSNLEGPSSADLRHRVALGPHLMFRYNKRVSLHLVAQWVAAFSKYDRVFSNAPQIRSMTSIHF